MVQLLQPTKIGLSEQQRGVLAAINLELTPLQEQILVEKFRFKQITGGEQGGKSVLLAAILVTKFAEDLAKHIREGWRLPMVYWLVGQDYSACEKEWEYIQDHFDALGLLRSRQKKLDPGLIEILGGPADKPVLAIIRTKSARDFHTLRAESPVGQLGCEASQIDYIAFQRMRTRAGGSRGWIALGGTIENGQPWYPQLHKEWAVGINDRKSYALPTESNTFLYPLGAEDPEIVAMKAESSDDFINERLMGIPAPVRGIVFPEFRPDFHVAEVTGDKDLPVHIVEDPGYGTDSAHAIYAIQVVDGQVQIIDEIYERGKTTEQLITGMVMKRWWWKWEIGYRVSDPHYATQHHANTSVDEIWMRLTRLGAQGDRQKVLPRIERIHSFLKANAISGAPQLVIHPNCTGILSELGATLNPFDHQPHVYKWAVDKDGNNISETPMDKWNHGLESLGRFLVYYFGHTTSQRRRTGRVKKVGGNHRNRRRSGR